MRVASEALGKDVPVPGSYALTPGNPQGIIDVTRTGASVTVTKDQSAVVSYDFLYTDVWVSMGERENVWADRIKLLTP